MQDSHWWSTLNRVGGDGRAGDIPTIIHKDGSEASTSQEKADAFGKYFASVIWKHKRNHTQYACECPTIILQSKFYLCVTFIELDVFMKTYTILFCKNAIETRTVRMACDSSTTPCCMTEGCEWPFALRAQQNCTMSLHCIRNQKRADIVKTFIDCREVHKYKHPRCHIARNSAIRHQERAVCRYR